MTHPLIPQILELARPAADDLGFEIVDATFHTNHSPPTLKISIRNRATQDTNLGDCEAMSLAVEAVLDETDVIPDAYVLEVSSPGIAKTLMTDREFVSFKGFPVVVNTSEPFKKKVSFTGQLIRRDEDAVYLNLKGRAIAIPRSIIREVQFAEQS
ncbi:MAG: ribosome maturation factor RimP [Elainellaceae cyanobacterium]